MNDFGSSDDPRVQAQLDRLARLSLPQGRIGLDPIRQLLGRLGRPQQAMPPAIHVAGTNGKGSTTAYLRAILEAAGQRVHTTTSPHLVRYNERIRLAGQAVANDELADLLAEVLDAADGLACSFFEVTIAASFLAFARHPGDVCVIEVGLGGRLDATNVLEHVLACCVATLGIDHERFLLAPEPGAPTAPLARIAWEKASIAKPGVPLITQAYGEEAAASVIATAADRQAPLFMRGRDWTAQIGAGISYRDAGGVLDLPLPTLPGAHQADNAALAVAVLRHQDRLQVPAAAMAQGIRAARWPARLQRLGPGPLTALVPGRAVWLDGGHNADAGRAIASHFAGAAPLHLILGMLENKDPAAIAEPLRDTLLSVSVVPVPGHPAHAAAAIAPLTALPVRAFPDVASALAALPPGADVLIAGSLYLAGQVLRDNNQVPD